MDSLKRNLTKQNKDKYFNKLYDGSHFITSLRSSHYNTKN